MVGPPTSSPRRPLLSLPHGRVLCQGVACVESRQKQPAPAVEASPLEEVHPQECPHRSQRDVDHAAPLAGRVHLATRQIRVGTQSASQAEKLAKKLAAVAGVTEAIVIAEEGIAYLKVNARTLDKKALESFSVS